MRNTLNDMNNHLFEQLERINNEDLTAEELEKEAVRTKAITEITDQIIQSGRLTIKAIEYGLANKPTRLLECRDEKV